MNIPGVFVILTIAIAEASIYTDVIYSIVAAQRKPVAVKEFSCNRTDSFMLLRELTKNGFQAKVIPAVLGNVGYEYPPNIQIFVLKMECSNSGQILTKAGTMKQFSSPFTWILFYEYALTTAEVLSSTDQYSFMVDSDITVCLQYPNGSVLMEKVYRFHITSPLRKHYIGHWTNNGGIVIDDLSTNIIRSRSNLMGTKLNTCIVITNNDTINHLTDRRDKHIDGITKVNYVLLQHLSDIMNMTLNYSIQFTWGYKTNTSEWTGMMGQLTRREADIGGTPLFFIIHRVDLIDYIAMPTPTRSKFIFREPKLSYITNVFTLPFDDYVWASTVSMLVITALVLCIIMKWEKNHRDRSNFKDHAVLEDSFDDTAFFSFGAFCQQGAPSLPTSMPGRITTIIIFLSMMFLYTSYAANIVALLQSSSNSIQTLEDLLKSRIDVGVDDTVFNRFYFPNATEPIRMALYKTKVAPPGKMDHFMPMEEGVKRMRKGLFAFHVETGAAYKLVGETFQEGEKCGLKEIQYLEVIDPYLAIQKNSSYKELLKIGYRKLQESGIQNRENSVIYTKKPTCMSRGSSFISVGIVDCYPAAVVFTGGLILSLFIVTAELLVYNRNAFWNNLKVSTTARFSAEKSSVPEHSYTQ